MCTVIFTVLSKVWVVRDWLLGSSHLNQGPFLSASMFCAIWFQVKGRKVLGTLPLLLCHPHSRSTMVILSWALVNLRYGCPFTLFVHMHGGKLFLWLKCNALILSASSFSAADCWLIFVVVRFLLIIFMLTNTVACFLPIQWEQRYVLLVLDQSCM